MIRKIFNLFGGQRTTPTEKPVDMPLEGEKQQATAFGPFNRGRPIHTQPVPKKPGHYRIVKKATGEMKYYGTAKDLSVRQKVHQRKGKFDPVQDDFRYQIARDGISGPELYAHEAKKIKKHKPTLNRNGGGGGRPWKRDPTET